LTAAWEEEGEDSREDREVDKDGSDADPNAISGETELLLDGADLESRSCTCSLAFTFKSGRVENVLGEERKARRGRAAGVVGEASGWRLDRTGLEGEKLFREREWASALREGRMILGRMGSLTWCEASWAAARRIEGEGRSLILRETNSGEERIMLGKDGSRVGWGRGAFKGGLECSSGVGFDRRLTGFAADITTVDESSTGRLGRGGGEGREDAGVDIGGRMGVQRGGGEAAVVASGVVGAEGKSRIGDKGNAASSGSRSSVDADEDGRKRCGVEIGSGLGEDVGRVDGEAVGGRERGDEEGATLRESVFSVDANVDACGTAAVEMSSWSGEVLEKGGAGAAGRSRTGGELRATSSESSFSSTADDDAREEVELRTGMGLNVVDLLEEEGMGAGDGQVGCGVGVEGVSSIAADDVGWGGADFRMGSGLSGVGSVEGEEIGSGKGLVGEAAIGGEGAGREGGELARRIDSGATKLMVSFSSVASSFSQSTSISSGLSGSIAATTDSRRASKPGWLAGIDLDEEAVVDGTSYGWW
jgi:hypothetical protein